MTVFKQNKTQCYGIEFPDICNYFPNHTMECIRELFRMIGCDPDIGELPLKNYNATNLGFIHKDFTKIKNEADTDSLSSLSLESCYGPTYFNITPDVTVKFVIDQLTFEESVEACRKDNALLIYKISNSTMQEKIETKLSTASQFGASDWWLGLDDVDVEGELLWSSGHKLRDGDYNNWEPTMPPTHPDKDCAVIDEYIDWKWRMDDCDVPRSFICQAVTCGSPVRFDPDETRADASLCDPECPPHHSCNNGTCVCSELFYHYNCSWVSGMDAALEEKIFNKNLVFFQQKANWADANEFCEGIGGTLAMPKTKSRHDYIYEKMMEVGLNITKASWLGMHDLDNDGQWQFMDGEAVNLPPVFKSKEGS
ncbi:secretory phospholipase A2 receptor-like [Ciona intestinalis]